ncbi:MAG: alpha/beta fold hydrolase [Actinomycetota bacterium]|nr:alpha/beta fold hydrolase [Actinomycetota bacterium]MDQ5808258.1 alpha/beta fold hydrolase [Actinomycetota bacterium]
MPLTTQRLRLHGHEVEYCTVGSGPAVLLVHGITSSLRTWRQVIPRLAEHHTVIAPDLLGHGASAKPRGDYSLGSFASGLRDIMIALDVPTATVVGHSMGGGIAMQLAYQFPERVERLVLVNSGGLGREVSLLLRAATLPGADLVLPLLFGTPLVRPAGAVVGKALEVLGVRSRGDLEGMAHGVASLRRRDGQRAFLHTARAIMDAGGQRVSATDRLYLAESMPTLIVWGERDSLIPADHGRAAQAAMPGSRLELFREAGHFPFNDDPDRFVDVLIDFIATTEASEYDEDRVRALMRRETARAG